MNTKSKTNTEPPQTMWKCSNEMLLRTSSNQPVHEFLLLIKYVLFDLFDLSIVNCQFPILDGDVPRSTSYGVYISQLIRFA